MSQNPVTTSPNHSIFAAAYVLSDRKFTRLIVTEKNKPVGVITLSDLVSVGAVLSAPSGMSFLNREGRTVAIKDASNSACEKHHDA